MPTRFAFRRILSVLAALAGGLGVGYFDHRTTEVVVTLGLMFTLNVTLGAAWPRGAWMHAILAALSAASCIWFRSGSANPHLPHTLASFAALCGVLFVAAAAGAYAGATGSRRERTSRTA